MFKRSDWKEFCYVQKMIDETAILIFEAKMIFV